MTKRKRKVEPRATKEYSASCCQVDAVVTIDERGQIVLPKDIRKRLSIEPGDKMAVVSYAKNNQTCCVILMKVGGLSGMVRVVLAPMAKEVLGG